MPTISPLASFHTSEPVMLPGSGRPRASAARWCLRISSQRMAFTWRYVGAVETTMADPGGWTATHQQLSTLETRLLPEEWQLATTVRLFFLIDSQISTCLDHRWMPSTSRAHPTGSVR
jgi:hypothetical protein